MVQLTTLLQGYRLGTDQGDLAFCGVNLLEGPDASEALKRIVVDVGHAGRRTVLEAALRRRGLSPPTSTWWCAPTPTGTTWRTSTW